MSARVHQIDRETRIVWIDHEGRGDEITDDFAIYNVDFIPSSFKGRVGIHYKRGMNEDSIGFFVPAVVKMVDTLTCRNIEESIQGRELADFVRGVRSRVGGAV